MRTVRLLENILDAGREALLVSPADPAESLHKARLQLKRFTSNPFKIIFKFSFPGIKYSLNSQIWGNENDSNVQKFLHPAEVLPKDQKEYTQPTHQCEYHMSLCTY